MTFYVAHTRISCVAISVCAQTRLCSKKRAMTTEGVDLDMKLPSTLRQIFKYEIKYIFSRKNSPGSFKLFLQTETVVLCQDQPLSLSLRAVCYKV